MVLPDTTSNSPCLCHLKLGIRHPGSAVSVPKVPELLQLSGVTQNYFSPNISEEDRIAVQKMQICGEGLGPSEHIVSSAKVGMFGKGTNEILDEEFLGFEP